MAKKYPQRVSCLFVIAMHVLLRFETLDHISKEDNGGNLSDMVCCAMTWSQMTLSTFASPDELSHKI